MSAAIGAPVQYDPFDGLLAGDPYAVYDQLRSEAPVYFSERHGFWALTRYDDVLGAMRDWKSFSTADGVDIDGTGDSYGSGDFLEEDPPRHDVLRAVVRSPFVPKRLKADMTDFIRSEVRSLIDAARGAGEIDLADALAWPLPVAVGTQLLGIPASDRSLLLGLQRRLAERTPGVRELPAQARAAATSLRAYFDELVSARRARPRTDVVSAIATSAPDGEPIADDAVGMTFLLFVASMETTASSIANALSLLTSHAEQLKWLSERTDAIPDAVEEVLRFEAPVQVTKRVTRQDIEIRGATIPARADVFLVLASANRDDARWERAGEFDITRRPLRHLAFGDGIHHCLGAPLARLELAILLEELFARRIAVAVRAPGRRLNSHFIRGFRELPGSLT